jgi:hypothetical protein
MRSVGSLAHFPVPASIKACFRAMPRKQPAARDCESELCARRREQLGTPIGEAVRVHPWCLECEGRCLSALLDFTVSL